MAIRFPVLDAAGRVEAVGTFAVDITERKEAEAALQASEARLNAINAANPVPMNIVRMSDRKLLFVNEPYLRLFGMENVDLESFDRTALYPDPAERDWYYAELEEGREVTDHETTLRRVDGTPVPVSVTSRQIVFQGEPAIVTAWADLTALRAAQAEVARSREALHQSEKLTALGRAAGRGGARAQQPAVGGGRLFLDAEGDRLRPGDGGAGGEDPRRRRALRPDRAHLPRHGPGAAAAARAGGAGRGGAWGRSTSPATGCAAPTWRWSSTCRRASRRCTATPTSCTRWW